MCYLLTAQGKMYHGKGRVQILLLHCTIYFVKFTANGMINGECQTNDVCNLRTIPYHEAEIHDQMVMSPVSTISARWVPWVHFLRMNYEKEYAFECYWQSWSGCLFFHSFSTLYLNFLFSFSAKDSTNTNIVGIISLIYCDLCKCHVIVILVYKESFEVHSFSWLILFSNYLIACLIVSF